MKCPYCGAEIKDGAKFCTNCGQSLEEETVSRDNLPDEPPKKEMEKLIRIIAVAAAVLITAVIGITLGIRSFAARQYQAGIQAYEAGEYETAMKALRSAVRWGRSEEAQKYLGITCAKCENWNEANTVLSEYISLYGNDGEAVDAYALSCEKLAQISLRDNDPETAVSWLKKEYDLTGDERVYKRLKAIEGGGIYADERGNVYNLDGLIETAVCTDVSDSELYRADLVYDAEGHWQTAKAYTEESPKKSVFMSFAWEDNTEYELHVYPDGEGYTWVAEKTVKDSDGRISSLITTSLTGENVLKYDYTENRNGCLLKETVTNAAGEKLVLEWPGEEKPDHAVISYGDQQYVAVISYDGAGRITSVSVTKNLLKTIWQITYKYNDDGTPSEVMVRDAGMPLTAWKPGKKYSRKLIRYSGGVPVSAEVYNEAGALSARAYYVENCGWLVMHCDAG